MMGEGDRLALAGEEHGMVTGDRAAAKRREADRPARPCAGMAVAHAHGMVGERNVAPLGGRLPEQQGRAGRRVDLVAMMHLEDLDIEIRIERPRRLADETGEQVDAEAHIAGLDDHRMARGGIDGGFLVGREARGANDVHDAGLRRDFGKADGRRRNGEIEHAFGSGEDRKRIVGDGDAERRQAG